MTTRLTVTVPSGISGGELVRVAAPDGSYHSVMVPSGLTAGQQFSVELLAGPAEGSAIEVSKLRVRAAPERSARASLGEPLGTCPARSCDHLGPRVVAVGARGGAEPAARDAAGGHAQSHGACAAPRRRRPQPEPRAAPALTGDAHADAGARRVGAEANVGSRILPGYDQAPAPLYRPPVAPARRGHVTGAPVVRDAPRSRRREARDRPRRLLAIPIRIPCSRSCTRPAATPAAIVPSVPRAPRLLTLRLSAARIRHPRATRRRAPAAWAPPHLVIYCN